MDVEEILEKLHENEMRVLKALQDGKPRTLRELSKATGLTRGAVERAVLWLSLKGLVELRERRVSVYEATEEGLEYAREGLPEKRLLKLLKAGSRPVSELKETFPRVGIALTWTMRRGWTRISHGVVEITEDGLEALSKTL
ncbi:MAG TPA: winged helix-turn-helix transcriptional regulator, partial [Candidatus Bathyarchaeota archaeon]|nr:winged helix-turn-helix transcriptional regulator [Candidatus Bathyarchaeota archaeon]